MYIVIIGCGKIGYHLTKALLLIEHEVVVIEKNPRRYAGVVEELGSSAIIGDGTEPELLQKVGIQRADVLIAATGSDEENLVATQVSKHQFGVPKTISLANNPENDNLLHDLGVDVVVSSTEIILAHVEEELPESALVHILPIVGSERQLVCVHIPSYAQVIGKSLREVVLPEGVLISMLVGSDGEPRLANDSEVFKVEDQVIVLTTPKNEKALLDVLTRIE